MIATVTISDQPAGQAFARTREVECAVRLGLQGWGSVELHVDRLELWPSRPGYYFRTLAEVLAHPYVQGVTFRGPWTPTSTMERAQAGRDRWEQLGTLDADEAH